MKTFAFFLFTLGCFFNSISAQSDSLITELEKTLQAQIDALGEEHLEIAMYCDSLGKMYMEVRNYIKADTLFRKGLEIKLSNLGENHLDLATSYTNLAETHRMSGDYEKAEYCLKRVLKIQIDSIGNNHLYVADSYSRLADVLQSYILMFNKYEYYEKIKTCHEKALKIPDSKKLGGNLIF